MADWYLNICNSGRWRVLTADTEWIYAVRCRKHNFILRPITLIPVSVSLQVCVSPSSKGIITGEGGVQQQDELVPKTNHQWIRALFIVSDDISLHSSSRTCNHQLHLSNIFRVDKFTCCSLNSERPTVLHSRTPFNTFPKSTPPTESNVIGCLRCRHRMLSLTKTS
jgi:hypothetical protein